jgi:hypothetical protein
MDKKRKMKAGEESFPPSWVGQEFLGGNPPCSEGGKKFPKKAQTISYVETLA